MNVDIPSLRATYIPVETLLWVLQAIVGACSHAHRDTVVTAGPEDDPNSHQNFQLARKRTLYSTGMEELELRLSTGLHLHTVGFFNFHARLQEKFNSTST